MSEEQEGSAHQVDYERFCTSPTRQTLGSEVQGEFFYLVQPYKISVYQYYSESKKPQLIEELIYNKLILHYAINEYYICILTTSFLEIRDRGNWNKLIYTHPTPEPITQPSIILDQHLLYLSIPQAHLSFERIDIKEKEILEIIHLGQGEKSHLLTKKPIFLRKMGNLEDFYLWSKDLQSVQMGMLYKHDLGHMNKFELSLIQLTDVKIHQIFYHKINSHELSTKSSEYLIVVSQNIKSKNLSVFLYEIFPRTLQNETEDEENLDSVVQQIEYLGNFNPIPKQKSLVKEVLQEAFEDSCQEELIPKKFELVLDNMKGYESSFYQNDKLWVLSPSSICCIQLYSDSSLEDIIKERDSKERLIIKSIDYQSKTEDKIGIGVYQDNLLFKENTISYMIRYEKDYTQSIAEEIMEDQELEQILGKKKEEEAGAIAEMYKNIIDATIEEKAQENANQDKEVQCLPGLFSYKSHYTHRHDKKSIHSKVYSETHHQFRQGTAEFGIQTDQVSHKIDDFQQIENLVAKYSSAVSVSCSKVKHSQIQKDKFDKEIKSIVDTMAKTVIEPFLEERFVAFLDSEVKRISCGITTVLLQELETLNDTMKKIEIKENHLRGKKIYDFSKQMENIKSSVSGVFDALKERELSKIASNQIILEEAKALKETAQNIEKQIVEISAKNQSSEREINDQIKEIINLVTQMCNREDSESEVEENGEESSQEEGIQRKQQRQSSQDQQSSQEEGQQISGYPSHIPPYSGKSHPEKKKIDSRRYPQVGYYPQYVPPPPLQFPFFYPYGPQNAGLSYQSLYGLPLHPPKDPYSLNTVPKKEKKKKK